MERQKVKAQCKYTRAANLRLDLRLYCYPEILFSLFLLRKSTTRQGRGSPFSMNDNRELASVVAGTCLVEFPKRGIAVQSK